MIGAPYWPTEAYATQDGIDEYEPGSRVLRIPLPIQEFGFLTEDSMEGEHNDRCGICTVLIDFLVGCGLVLRHLNEDVAAEKICRLYIDTAKQICPEIRKVVEAKEREFDGETAGIPRELRDGQSTLRRVVGSMYGESGEGKGI
ncbi:hypothetical protein ES707_21036 [subsurface metagenome]